MIAARLNAIVVIAWGSLTWDPGKLQVEGAWQLDGPQLPIEFARISIDGRVTLVILDGASRSTACWAYAKSAKVSDAREQLQLRESTVLGRIHCVSVFDEPTDAVALVVQDWLRQKGFSAAVWTGLPSNWSEKRQRSFSPADVVDYFRQLPEVKLVRAREYVVRAPSQIQTPTRALLQSELGWM